MANNEVQADIVDLLKRVHHVTYETGWESSRLAVDAASYIERLRKDRDELREALDAAKDVLSWISSYLGTGLGDDNTTVEQFENRIRDGFDMQAKGTLLFVEAARTNARGKAIEECLAIADDPEHDGVQIADAIRALQSRE